MTMVRILEKSLETTLEEEVRNFTGKDIIAVTHIVREKNTLSIRLYKNDKNVKLIFDRTYCGVTTFIANEKEEIEKIVFEVMFG
jgi:hypothetical protein